MSRTFRSAILIALSHTITLSVLGTASAQSAPTGAPPPEAKALVEAPKNPSDAPKIEDKADGTTVTLSAGGQAATGNARLLAATVNGAFDKRFNKNGIGFSLLGNYSRTAMPGEEVQTTAQNLQGRARYDRYFVEQASGFLIATGRHDRGTGIDFRLNLDPGLKYLFVVEQANSVWAEAGYDFQYDIRRDDALADPTGMNPPLDKTAVDHSSRAFVGMRHAFNEQVTLSAGVEYLQSFVESTRSRVNFDALFAAKVGAGLALGVGVGMRYDHAPLPGKENLDTSTNLTIIYSFSDVKEEPPPPPPPPAPPPPPPPPADLVPVPASEGGTPNGSNPAAPLNPMPAPPPASEPAKPPSP